MAADGVVSTDEDSLVKAMRRKAEYNIEPYGMDCASKSFLSFSQSDISSKLSKVGVNLGRDTNQIAVSTRALRHMEFDRLTVIPKASAMPVIMFGSSYGAN